MASRLAHLTPQALLNPARSVARVPRPCILAHWLPARHHSTTPASSPSTPPEAIPLRKHLKDEAKRRKAISKSTTPSSPPKHPDWDLTVGIEIHAELNTAAKLFSPAPGASATHPLPPNTAVAPFDAALPGSQPTFQPATLLPALRAALALGCAVQRRSGWDRKHYFHWDQPSGYQLTQYYEPFARDGKLVLTADDGVPAADLTEGVLQVGIKQVQLEQDTAKTVAHAGGAYRIDLNRAGHPLIEVITLPQIRSAAAAAAVVRRVQGVLRGVDACVTGMELGGLRADVNVSVKRRGGGEGAGMQYAGFGGLGQRTEIKNLSSFAAIEAAIEAERERQIGVLERGGVIEGETRGWTLGATETTRLRGKEGEVDYRYMPDPDLPPLLIGQDLIDHLTNTLPELPHDTVYRIQAEYGISAKDARTLAALNDGDRLDFMERTVSQLTTDLTTANPQTQPPLKQTLGKLATNWTLHELGALLTATDTPWPDLHLSSSELAALLSHLHQKHLTTASAKTLLAHLHTLAASSPAQPRPTVASLIDTLGLRLTPMSDATYERLARTVLEANPEMVEQVLRKGQKGKVMWFVGQMVRRAGVEGEGWEGTVEAGTARVWVEGALEGMRGEGGK